MFPEKIFLVYRVNGKPYIGSQWSDVINEEDMKFLKECIKSQNSLNKVDTLKIKMRDFLQGGEVFSSGKELEDIALEFEKNRNFKKLDEESKDRFYFYLNEYRKSFEKEAREVDNSTKVYLMLDEKNGAYKIGRSNSPEVRESTLQSEKPFIKLIDSWKGEFSDETELHRKFKEKRIRGEWFDLDEDDVIYIQNYFNNK